MYKHASTIAMVLTISLLVFAGTANAFVTPFSWSEDFSYSGSEGDDLPGTLSGWDWPGEADMSLDTIDSGQSGKPGHTGFWHIQYGLGFDIDPLNLDPGQQYILEGYFTWVSDIDNNDWIRLGLVNGTGNGPNASLGRDNSGEYAYFNGGSDFSTVKSYSIDIVTDDLIGLRVTQTKVSVGNDVTEGHYNINGGAWTSIGSSVTGTINNITRIHLDGAPPSSPIDLRFDTFSAQLTPEPSSLVMMSLGSLLLSARFRRRRR